MGARIILCDPHRAVVNGPARLYGERMESPDIRAGMAMLIASLAAEGRSTIGNIGQIDRGYESIDERLRAVGAAIERLDELSSRTTQETPWTLRTSICAAARCVSVVDVTGRIVAALAPIVDGAWTALRRSLRTGCILVGGGVRDVLIGARGRRYRYLLWRAPGIELAEALLPERLGGRVTIDTASSAPQPLRLTGASAGLSPQRARRHYAHPGCATECRSTHRSSRDLFRRDFTAQRDGDQHSISAERGRAHRPPRWSSKILRPGPCACCTSARSSTTRRASFRAARYEARLRCFALDPASEALARSGGQLAGHLRSLSLDSGSGGELVALLARRERGVAALARLETLGADARADTLGLMPAQADTARGSCGTRQRARLNDELGAGARRLAPASGTCLFEGLKEEEVTIVPAGWTALQLSRHDTDLITRAAEVAHATLAERSARGNLKRV